LSIAYLGNVVDLWERLAGDGFTVDLGSDQTSLHNPYGGGYTRHGVSFEDAQILMSGRPGELQGQSAGLPQTPRRRDQTR
jgi:urocanate hydratase